MPSGNVRLADAGALAAGRCAPALKKILTTTLDSI
jgi:hypothetical protein